MAARPGRCRRRRGRAGSGGAPLPSRARRGRLPPCMVRSGRPRRRLLPFRVVLSAGSSAAVGPRSPGGTRAPSLALTPEERPAGTRRLRAAGEVAAGTGAANGAERPVSVKTAGEEVGALKFGQFPRTSSVKTEGVIAGGFNVTIAAGVVPGLLWFPMNRGISCTAGRCGCVRLTL